MVDRSGNVPMISAGWNVGVLAASGKDVDPGTVTRASRVYDACVTPTCSNPACASKIEEERLERQRIVFAGRHVCSAACLLVILKDHIRKEQRIGVASLATPPPVLIGQILMDQGFVTASQLERALQAQRSSGEFLGECLKKQTQLSDEEFTAALSIQSYCPVYRVGVYVPERMVTFLPIPLVNALGALPLRINNNPDRLTICFADRLDRRVMSACERMHGIPVEGGLLGPNDIRQVRKTLLDTAGGPYRTVQARNREAMLRGLAQTIIDHSPQDARLVFVRGHLWLRMWAARRTSCGERAKPFDIVCRLGGVELKCTNSDMAEEVW